MTDQSRRTTAVPQALIMALIEHLSQDTPDIADRRKYRDMLVQILKGGK